MFQLSSVRIVISPRLSSSPSAASHHATELSPLSSALGLSPGLGPFLGAPRHLSYPLLSINQNIIYHQARLRSQCLG